MRGYFLEGLRPQDGSARLSLGVKGLPVYTDDDEGFIKRVLDHCDDIGLVSGHLNSRIGKAITV